MDFYNQGLDLLSDWTTGDFRWLLLTGGSFNADDNFVADVLDGFEVTVVGYTRELVSTPTRTVNDTSNRISSTAQRTSTSGPSPLARTSRQRCCTCTSRTTPTPSLSAGSR